MSVMRDYLFMKEFVANAVYDDYDRLVQLCDALAMLLRGSVFGKEICRRDNAIRRSPATIDRWKKILEIKERFEDQIGCSILCPASGRYGKQFSLRGDIVLRIQ